jgi:hypothetical protein
MALPIIPHDEFGADCCGCRVEIIGETTEYRCNGCGAVIPAEEGQRVVMEMPSVEATCPHCGKINRVDGFFRRYSRSCAAIAERSNSIRSGMTASFLTQSAIIVGFSRGKAFCMGRKKYCFTPGADAPPAKVPRTRCRYEMSLAWRCENEPSACIVLQEATE